MSSRTCQDLIIILSLLFGRVQAPIWMFRFKSIRVALWKIVLYNALKLTTCNIASSTRVVLEKLICRKCSKSLSLFCVAWWFIFKLSRAHLLSFSPATQKHTTQSHKISWWFILIFHPPIYALIFQVASSPQASLPKPRMHVSSSPTFTKYPDHLILLDLITEQFENTFFP